MTSSPPADRPTPVPQPPCGYDAIVLLSFGGPEGPDEVLPFLRSVTAGTGIPDARLREVGRHYDLFGGKSPLNDLNRALVGALTAELTGRGLDLPVLLGNRHAPPFLVDVLRQAAHAGHHRLLVLLTSAYRSYASCRAYREHLADALATLAQEGLTSDDPATAGPSANWRLAKVAPYARRPAFARSYATATVEALRELETVADDDIALLFVTHSIPAAMDDTSGPAGGDGHAYLTDHQQVAADVTRAVNDATGRSLRGELVFCSRSGRPGQAWLEPDIDTRICELAGQVAAVVAVPIGFVSDHMEVVYDLDHQSARTAAEAGLRFLRVPTIGTDPRFIADLADVLLELAVAPGQPPGQCPAGCCPNPAGPRPALCGQD